MFCSPPSTWFRSWVGQCGHPGAVGPRRAGVARGPRGRESLLGTAGRQLLLVPCSHQPSRHAWAGRRRLWAAAHWAPGWGGAGVLAEPHPQCSCRGQCLPEALLPTSCLLGSAPRLLSSGQPSLSPVSQLLLPRRCFQADHSHGSQPPSAPCSAALGRPTAHPCPPPQPGYLLSPLSGHVLPPGLPE